MQVTSRSPRRSRHSQSSSHGAYNGPVLHAETVLMMSLVLASCKADKREAARESPPPAVPVQVEKRLLALPAAPTAAIDPIDATDAGVRRDSMFPAEPPAIVVWRGTSADTPTTELSLRIWTDGSVRFKCGRRGVLPRERVAALVDAFV